MMHNASATSNLGTSLPVLPDRRFLESTFLIDSDNPIIKSKSNELTQSKSGDTKKVVALFYFVRDQIPYNLFVQRDKAEDFIASRILNNHEGYCVQKAVLLAALARAVGIPAGLGFARIRNHRLPEKTLQILRTNILPFHGYTELILNVKWVKATPAWDARMSEKAHSYKIDFDGKSDAMLPEYDIDGQPHVEYLLDLGHGNDVPLERLWGELRLTYGRVNLTR